MPRPASERDVLRGELNDARPEDVIRYAILMARDVAGYDYIQSVSYGSEISLDGMCVDLYAEREDRGRVTVRVELPGGEPVGHVTVYLGRWS